MNILKKIISFFSRNNKMLSDGNKTEKKVISKKEESFRESIRVNQEFKVKKKSGKIEAIFCEGDGTGICKYGG